MKRILIIPLFLFFLLFNAQTAHASTIFEDSFQEGVNNENWSILNSGNLGSYFTQGTFGIKDTSSHGFYTVLNSLFNSYENNNEIQFDIKIDNNDPSTFNMSCRHSLLSVLSAQFYSAGNGNTLDTLNGVDFVNYTWDNSNGIHHFDIICSNSNIKIIEDNHIIYNDTNHVYQIDNGNDVQFTFGDGHSSEFANFKFCDINGCAPAGISLSVPLLKQTDPLWKNYTYDKADIWSPSNPTIGNWGCAVTSAAMVLNYYNIHKLPGQGNTDLTPATLDAWLNTQPDGYIGNGLLNWLAVSRLTYLAKSNNPDFSFDALEYKRIGGKDDTTLLADLNAGHPDILEEPGHFVVATGQNSSNIFTINDPYYLRDTLASYGNNYSSIGSYIPSFTDLSYILITSQPDITLTLKDDQGNPVGESYIQQPIKGTESNTQSGNTIDVLTLKQPLSGKYTLTISSSNPQTTTISGYLYDTQGNPSPFTKVVTIDPQNQSTYEINFTPEDASKDTITKVVTFDSFLKDLTDLYNSKEIKKGTFNSFKSLIQNAQKQQQKHHTFLEKGELILIEGLLKAQKRLMSDNAYQILLEDVQYLEHHL